MRKSTDFIQILLFSMFIAVFFILNTVLPSREFSERENRYLEQMPAFNLKKLASGEFTSAFEKFTTDQFVFRDSWTALKAGAEILSGKSENNGVYLCIDDTLIKRFDAPEDSRLQSNTGSVKLFAEKESAPVYLAIIPGAAELWPFKLPKNAPNDSQLNIIEDIYKNMPATTVDVFAELERHSDEYIFYRTDHHWTSLGAYYGAHAILNAMGMGDTLRPLNSYAPETVTDSFYGTAYSSSGMSWVDPDSISIFAKPSDDVSVTTFKSGTAEDGSLYDMSWLEKKDKYSMFLGGVSPIVRIKTGIDDSPTLLVFRDSYMDSLTPFLLNSFSEIHLIDLRYYRESVSDYIAQNSFDKILICYSAANFCEETSLYRLGT